MNIKTLLVLLIALGLSRAYAQNFSVGPALASTLAPFTLALGATELLKDSTSQPSALGVMQPDALSLLFGKLEPGFMGKQISVRLMAWSLPWIAAGVAGLWAGTNDWQRGFWGMNATWGLINTSIAYAGLLGSEPNAGSLQNILWINAGLDILYVASGAYMMSRSEDAWRGAGLAVIIQGAFLLVFDGLHALML